MLEIGNALKGALPSGAFKDAFGALRTVCGTTGRGGGGGLGSSSQRASSGLLGARALHAANVEPLCLLSFVVEETSYGKPNQQQQGTKTQPANLVWMALVLSEIEFGEDAPQLPRCQCCCLACFLAFEHRKRIRQLYEWSLLQ